MSGLRSRVSALLAVVLAVVALWPESAAARRRVTIRGRGWGHGIGMSQYGALGRARRGHSAARILEHYYSRAQVRRARMPRRVRVGLLQGARGVTVRSRVRRSGRGRLTIYVGRTRLARGSAGTTWRFEPSPTGGVRLYRNGRRVKRDGTGVFGGPDRGLRVEWRRGTLLRLPRKGIHYAFGRLLVSTHSASCGRAYCLRAVLSLPMQAYVYGLGEVPASWPGAVLRAQAIAARTYALARIRSSGQRREPCGCALVDSPADQVYSGDAKRTGSGPYWDDWKSAVDATNRKVVMHRGSPIQALYSSSSGGHTENVENVWGSAPIRYLRGVRDRADDVPENPNHRWRVRMTWRSFARRLRFAFGVGRVKRVRLVRPFGVSGRVTVVKSRRRGGVRVVGGADTARVSGWDVRNALGLRDTWFRVRVRFGVEPAVASAYRSSGGRSGPLGRATSERVELPGRDWVQRFRGGAIYAVAGRAPVALWGPIARRYERAAATESRCGAPLTSPRAMRAGLRATFTRGTISATDAGARLRCG